jgi:hypothetical protein
MPKKTHTNSASITNAANPPVVFPFTVSLLGATRRKTSDPPRTGEKHAAGRGDHVRSRSGLPLLGQAALFRRRGPCAPFGAAHASPVRDGLPDCRLSCRARWPGLLGCGLCLSVRRSLVFGGGSWAFSLPVPVLPPRPPVSAVRLLVRCWRPPDSNASPRRLPPFQASSLPFFSACASHFWYCAISSR